MWCESGVWRERKFVTCERRRQKPGFFKQGRSTISPACTLHTPLNVSAGVYTSEHPTRTPAHRRLRKGHSRKDTMKKPSEEKPQKSSTQAHNMKDSSGQQVLHGIKHMESEEYFGEYKHGEEDEGNEAGDK